MNKHNNQQNKRAESLQAYKSPTTLELPRFHSKPKNGPSPYLQQPKKIQTQSNRKSKTNSKQSTENNKRRINNIINKVKFRKKQDILPRKPISEKKISSGMHFEVEEKSEKVKINFKSTGLKPSTKTEESKTQFRSKSLKNAVKLKEHLPTQAEKEKKKKQHPTQLSTEPTQMLSPPEVDRNMWFRIIQLFKLMTLEPGNLDWPEEYIVMDKHNLQKRLYNSFNGTQWSKAKQKIKKHICITRISIYLYANMILNMLDTKSMLGMFERIKQSFIMIYDMIFINTMDKYKEKLIGLNRNNQFNLKTLVTILSKRKIPHNSLLKNMLESSIKIDSFEFIEILDKTLKWEILRMPSFPYLPSSHKDKYLVLDLDQTLVHYDNKTQVFHVRPFAQEFLKKISKVFQVIIFTAATQEYADQILNQIDPEHCISYKLYRNHLTYLENVPIKDLAMLGRPLHKTMIVDNIAGNYRLQPQNGIQILSWYHDDEDDILGKLYALLLKIVAEFEKDFREGINHFGKFIKEQITKDELIYELKNEL